MARVKNKIKDGDTGKMGKRLTAGAVCAIHLFLCSTAGAASYSFTGAFSADDDVLLFNFTADGTSAVVLQTYGYGGGTMGDGREVAPGGFDPMLTLFGTNGYMGTYNNGYIPAVGNGLAPDLGLDVRYQHILEAGDYTVALTQYGNFSVTTIDGFTQTGNPNYTSGFEETVPCSQGQFCSGEDNRTSSWALEILNVESASVVPVPAAVWLFGSGLLGLIAVARRYKA